jgi:hypothetical protein
MIHSVVCANGIYDIVCAIAIILYPSSSMGRLHTDVFVAPMDDIARRMLAYWVFTYGIVRLVAVLHHPAVDRLIVATYLLEGVVFALEALVHHTTYHWKVLWIVGTCILFMI